VHEYPDFELTMHSFICIVESSELTLREHIDKKWLKIDELKSLDWAGADIPIVEKLVSNG
jgi:8-oxo-dGTP diphosphatase